MYTIKQGMTERNEQILALKENRKHRKEKWERRESRRKKKNMKIANVDETGNELATPDIEDKLILQYL